MSKPHRGSNIRGLYAHGRGECPVCKRTNVKVLFEQESGDQKFKICKVCRAAIKHGTKSLPVVASAKPATEAAAPAKAAPAAEKPAEPAKAAEPAAAAPEPEAASAEETATAE